MNQLGKECTLSRGKKGTLVLFWGEKVRVVRAVWGVLCHVPQKHDFVAVFIWRLSVVYGNVFRCQVENGWTVGAFNVPTCPGQIVFSGITSPGCF